MNFDAVIPPQKRHSSQLSVLAKLKIFMKTRVTIPLVLELKAILIRTLTSYHHNDAIMSPGPPIEQLLL